MKIQDFTGGLNTRLRPQYLALNQGEVYENIDNTKGTLLPVKSKINSGIKNVEKYAYFYESKGEWLSSSTKRDFVEFNNVLYIANREGRAQKYDGTNTYNLGIDQPTASPSIALQNTPSAVLGIQVNTVEVGGATALSSVDQQYLLVNADLQLGQVIQSNAVAVVVDLDGDPAINSVDFPRPNENPEDEGAPTTGPDGPRRSITFSACNTETFGDQGVLVYRWYDGSYYLVGSLANELATLTDNVEDISANAVFDEDSYGNLQGIYQYGYTYYNSGEDIESPLSPLTPELDFSNGGSANVSVVKSADPQVDKIRIYRIGGNLTELTRVIEIENQTQTYEDEFFDVDIAGNFLAPVSGLPPENIKYFFEAYAMLFGIVDNRLYFSEIGNPNIWPATNFLEFDAELTGGVPVANGILVFTKFRTSLITGTVPEAFAQQVLSADQGCISFDSVQRIDDIAIWASTDGLCVSGGADVKVISQDNLGKLSLRPDNSVIFDQVYYLVETDGTILTFDFRYNKIFRRLNLGITSITKGNDTLYGWNNGVFYELFASYNYETFKYRSPRFLEGSATNHKAYKKIYLYSKGQITLRIYINDKLVQTKEFNTEDSHTVQVPQISQRGFFIQFELEGTGEVYEYEYTPEKQLNG